MKNKLQAKVSERRTITVQAWTLEGNKHIVQVFVGNVEIRRWVLPSSSDAEGKFHYLLESFENNSRLSIS